MTLLAWCVAWLLDFIIGDPQSWPHPVRWIGNLITAVQQLVRRYCHSDGMLRIGGAVLWVVVVGVTWGVSWSVLALAQSLHPWLGWGVEVWMIFTVLAGRCLANAARDVERPLRANNLAESREKLSGLWGVTPHNCSRNRSIAQWWKPSLKTPLTASLRRCSSCFSAARRWRWPTKR